MSRVGLSTSLLLLTLAVASGCGSSSASRERNPEESSITSTRFYDAEPAAHRTTRAGPPVSASSLVFDPPVTYNQPPLNLARAERQPGAFFGFQGPVTEYYRVTVDDRQLGTGSPGYGGGWGYGHGGYGRAGWFDRYERRAYSDKSGVIYR